MSNSTFENKNPPRTSSSALPIIFAWLWVGIPLAWGIEQTFVKALGLFQ